MSLFGNHNTSEYISPKNPIQLISTKLDENILSNVSNSGIEKITIYKVSTNGRPETKRRRSHSHNESDSSSLDMFNGNLSDRPILLKSKDSSNITTIINRHSDLFDTDQHLKDKFKKETHNRVERKRRDFINLQIQKLANLLPSEFFINNEHKMNKGIILKNSVEYISSLKILEQINQCVLHENELGSKLIQTLLKVNKHFDVSKAHFIDESEDDSTDVVNLFNQWYSLRQQNHQTLRNLSQKFSNTFSISNAVDDTYKGRFKTQSMSYLAGRKRYSSLPSNFEHDSHLPKVKSPVSEALPILNSLLKPCDSSNNKRLNSIFQIESTDEDVDYFLHRSTNPLTCDINTDNALIVDIASLESTNNDKILQSKDKTYFVLPKSKRLVFESLENEGSNNANNIAPVISDMNIDLYDPMLLSDSSNSSIIRSSGNNEMTVNQSQVPFYNDVPLSDSAVSQMD